MESSPASNPSCALALETRQEFERALTSIVSTLLEVGRLASRGGAPILLAVVHNGSIHGSTVSPAGGTSVPAGSMKSTLSFSRYWYHPALTAADKEAGGGGSPYHRSLLSVLSMDNLS